MNRFQCAIAALLVSIVALYGTTATAAAQAEEPVVHAVLFYSPTCPHCHHVISDTLPPLFAEYGEQLQILYVDISQAGGHAVFEGVLAQFEVPPPRQGVPLMVIGDEVLVGGHEIPEQLPVLIEEYLAQGGLDWPNLPGLHDALDEAEQQNATATTEPTAAEPGEQPAPDATAVVAANSPDSERSTTGSHPDTEPLIISEQPATLSVGERLALDPAGNGLAVAVLFGMVLMVGYSAATVQRPATSAPAAWQEWTIPVLCLVGLGVAGYLAFVETTDTSAVCGPVGDCNTVQQSEYARLFGVLPIGVLGIVGYVLIALAWLVSRSGTGPVADWSRLALLAMTLGGTLFSIYLTFLEPFVIGASCAWCLTSAVIMTLLFWLSIVPGKQAWARLREA